MRSLNAARLAHYAPIGESQACETHLVPDVLRPVLGSSARLLLFGEVLVASGGKAHELQGRQRR